MLKIRSPLAFAVLAALSSAAQGQYSFYTATGHYYQAVYAPAGITWLDANAAATASGGYLASILSAPENDFVYSLLTNSSVGADAFFSAGSSNNGDRLGPWFGAKNVQGPKSFQWSSGEAVDYVNWRNGQPDGYPGDGSTQYGQFYGGGSIGSTWGDDSSTSPTGYHDPKGYIVEYNANPVPEPSAFAALGLTALALVRKRRREAARGRRRLPEGIASTLGAGLRV